ncbi:MAG: helix-turn-helix domain-containing protein [Dehalococcoidia bacterium]|nr:helix-turn-helix domain-containing protein [Dehalococcoidia bacterium]
MDLIEALKTKQGDMSQAKFAAALGISEAILSLIYSGKRRIGEDMARRIVRAYPDLRYLVIGYLMTKDDGDAAS